MAGTGRRCGWPSRNGYRWRAGWEAGRPTRRPCCGSPRSSDSSGLSAAVAGNSRARSERMCPASSRPACRWGRARAKWSRVCQEPLAPHAFVIVPQDFGLSTADVYREADRLGLPRDAGALASRERELRRALDGEGELPARHTRQRPRARGAVACTRDRENARSGPGGRRRARARLRLGSDRVRGVVGCGGARSGGGGGPRSGRSVPWSHAGGPGERGVLGSAGKLIVARFAQRLVPRLGRAQFPQGS